MSRDRLRRSAKGWLNVEKRLKKVRRRSVLAGVVQKFEKKDLSDEGSESENCAGGGMGKESGNGDEDGARRKRSGGACDSRRQGKESDGSLRSVESTNHLAHRCRRASWSGRAISRGRARMSLDESSGDGLRERRIGGEKRSA